jgi:biopolymer transport protein ExbD
MQQAGRPAAADGSDRRPEMRPAGRGPATQPPLTPMIDVVFQLLLFFLLGCRFVPEEAQLKANLPKTGEDRTVRIRVYLSPTGPAGSGVLVEVAELKLATTSMAALHEALRGFMQVPEARAASFVIQPVGSVRWQHVVNAFHQASRAGCRTVVFGKPGSRLGWPVGALGRPQV